MITLHCTGKVLKRFQLEPVAHVSTPTTILGDWYANLLNVGSQRHVLCMSERTFLPIILPARKSEFPSQLGSYLEPLLAALGIPQNQIIAELQQMAEYSIATTQSRQVLGVMNDFGHLAKYHLLRDDRLENSLRLATVISRPLAYSSPDRATCKAFGAPKF